MLASRLRKDHRVFFSISINYSKVDVVFALILFLLAAFDTSTSFLGHLCLVSRLSTNSDASSAVKVCRSPFAPSSTRSLFSLSAPSLPILEFGNRLRAARAAAHIAERDADVIIVALLWQDHHYSSPLLFRPHPSVCVYSIDIGLNSVHLVVSISITFHKRKYTTTGIIQRKTVVGR